MTSPIANTAFIANTDFGWFSHFLHRAELPVEVDFWQPSPHGFRAIPPGAPFFFRLGVPHKAIASFGFFARHERVPAWPAWAGGTKGVPGHRHIMWFSVQASRGGDGRRQ